MEEYLERREFNWRSEKFFNRCYSAHDNRFSQREVQYEVTSVLTLKSVDISRISRVVLFVNPYDNEQDHESLRILSPSWSSFKAQVSLLIPALLSWVHWHQDLFRVTFYKGVNLPIVFGF